MRPGRSAGAPSRPLPAASTWPPRTGPRTPTSSASRSSTPAYRRTSRSVLAWFHSTYVANSSSACSGECSRNARISGWPIHDRMRTSSSGAPSTVVKACWYESTISPMVSTRVPSRSKTTYGQRGLRDTNDQPRYAKPPRSASTSPMVRWADAVNARVGLAVVRHDERRLRQRVPPGPLPGGVVDVEGLPVALATDGSEDRPRGDDVGRRVAHADRAEVDDGCEPATADQQVRAEQVGVDPDLLAGEDRRLERPVPRGEHR